MKRFIIFTADYSGLPLALRLQHEGYDVTTAMIHPSVYLGVSKTPDAKKDIDEELRLLMKNGEGLVDKVWSYDIINRITPSDDLYIIFDQIYGWQYGEYLRKRGFKVLGGLQVGYELETQRDLTLKTFAKLGVDMPKKISYPPGSVDDAIDFLRNSGDDRLFVLKSDTPKVATLVANDSNEEIIQKLDAERSIIDKYGFILQEKVEGIELTVESWYYDGKPIMTNLDLEAKRKYNESCEVQTGCSFDLIKLLPNDCELYNRVLKPLEPLVKSQIGTGLIDLTVIYDNRSDRYYALECCGSRFGYNSIYTTLELSKVPVGELFASYLDGDLTSDYFDYNKIGGSVRIFNDNKLGDQPITYPDELSDHVWVWDAYYNGEDMLTVGSSESTAILTSAGDTPESAYAKVREIFQDFHMPSKWIRDDFEDKDIVTLPLARYYALRNLRLL